jgi:hypothetical protein
MSKNQRTRDLPDKIIINNKYKFTYKSKNRHLTSISTGTFQTAMNVVNAISDITKKIFTGMFFFQRYNPNI